MSFVVFTMIPMWESICLGRVSVPYTRTIMTISKFLGAASNIIDTCSAFRASPPHTCKHPFSLNLAPGYLASGYRNLCSSPVFKSICIGHFYPFTSYYGCGRCDHWKVFYFSMKEFFAVCGVQMILDKIKVSKLTKTASKRPHSRR